MFLAKQDLKSVPFQLVHEKAVLAANKVKYDMQELEKIHYEKAIAERAKMYNCTKEEAEALNPFTPTDPALVAETASKARLAAVSEQLVILDLKKKAGWLMPQIAAYLSSMKLPMVDGKVDIKEFLSTNFAKDDWHKGLYSTLVYNLRGTIVPTQTAPESRPYSALIPLMLMPFKRFHGVPYSAWDSRDLALVVDPNLFAAMRYTTDREYTTEQILLDRTKCLTTSSGVKAGTVRNPATWHKLYSTKDTVFEDMPWLAQVMLSQIWVAHPSNRSDLMVLDWKNWDSMPQPLIDVEVIPVRKPKPAPFIAPSLPWDD